MERRAAKKKPTTKKKPAAKPAKKAPAKRAAAKKTPAKKAAAKKTPAKKKPPAKQARIKVIPKDAVPRVEKLPWIWRYETGRQCVGLWVDDDLVWASNDDGEVVALTHDGEVRRFPIAVFFRFADGLITHATVYREGSADL